MLCFLILLLGVQAHATHIWTGASNNDWKNTGNWNPASVPNGSDFVIIPNVANDPEIKDATYAYVSGIEIQKDASLKIHGDGSLFIDGSIDDAILNKGTLNNLGYISIGYLVAINGSGIRNHGLLLNNISGWIRINRCKGEGIFSANGDIQNFGKIQIGEYYSIEGHGISMYYGNFINAANAEITIDRTLKIAFWNEDLSNFSNSGKLKIGSIANIGEIGIQNNGTFDNYGTGEIFIDRVAEVCIHNESYDPFNNLGKIQIGGVGVGGDVGIENNSVFNHLGGEIKIDRVRIAVLNNLYGYFSNSANLIIGSIGSLSFYGISNGGFFQNTAGSLITIDRVIGYGIETHGQLKGSLSNAGKIIIGGTTPYFEFAIYNDAAFNNEAGAELIIDYVTSGIKNVTPFDRPFKNKGKIMIGQSGSVGHHGISNSGGFVNETYGEINIDRSNDAGLLNVSTFGDFNNKGRFTIGASSSTGLHGILNQGGFFNNAMGSELSIDRATQIGLFNESGSMSNSGTIYVLGIAGNFSLKNLGAFSNSACAVVRLNDAVYNDGTLTNDGLLSVTTLSAHTNVTGMGKFFKNNGVMEYVLGNPIPNVLHHDIIVVPISAVCNSITPALDLGSDLSFTVASTWYSNPGLTIPAGTYNKASNTFIATAAASILYFLVHDDVNGCDRLVSVKANYQLDNIPPSIVCKNTTAFLNANGTTSISPGQVFQSGTDNCGEISLTSVTPNAFQCVNLGANTVTLKAGDGNGNFATCQATVTVADKIVPTMLCKPVSIALNAAGQASLTPAQINNGSYDNCGIVTIVTDKSSFDCSNVGVNSVTLWGVDQSANKGQCIAVVTVIDPIKPVALCKNVTANLNADGALTLAGGMINNGSSDNCSFNLSVTPGNFNCANIGINTVTLKATDNAGNSATCTAKLTIRDLTAPTALCKNTSIFLNDVGQATLSAAQINNGSSDACGIATMTLSKTTFNCSDIPGSAQTVILTLKDVNNNTSTCSAQVTTKDNLAPTAVCENTSVQLGVNGMVTVYPANLAADSYDNCSVWSYSPVAKVYTSANLGNNNLSITAKDWSNNGATCVSVVQVLPYSGLRNAEPEQTLGTDLENGFLQVFPNPSTGEGTLNFDLLEAQDFTVVLFDLSGKILWSRQGSGVQGQNTVSITALNLPASVYFIDLQSESLKKQVRWVIQN